MRREARELALQCLHQWDVRGPDEGVELADALIRERAPEAAVAAFARTLLENYWERRVEVDEAISRVAENWRLDRIALVDRSILRLAVTELLTCEDIPPQVTLDEAIEIAKKFSTAQSGSFVNGILDRIVSELKADHGAG